MKLDITKEFLLEEEREGFIVPALMKRCWATKLQMICDINEVCVRNGIRFYADYGTLLGAARHRGFVPWDDDIDISMFRDDYNRAIPILRRELPETYEVFSFGNNLFSAPWTYINNRRGWDVGEGGEAARITAGFFGDPYCETIDLFPLDYVPADEAEREVFLEIHSLIFDVILQYNEGKELGIIDDLADQIVELTGQPLPRGDALLPALAAIEAALAQVYTRDISVGVDNIGNMANHSRTKWRDLSWYERTVYLPFEMIEIPAPVGYREIIRTVFGSGWMIPVKNTATHEYPCYMRQEREILAYWEKKGAPRPDPLGIS